jgi:hypothetical protein
MGHVARRQIRQRGESDRRTIDAVGQYSGTPEERRELERIMLPIAGENGAGMALTGIIIGWTVFVLWLGFWVPFASGFLGPPPRRRPANEQIASFADAVALRR